MTGGGFRVRESVPPETTIRRTRVRGIARTLEVTHDVDTRLALMDRPTGAVITCLLCAEAVEYTAELQGRHVQHACARFVSGPLDRTMPWGKHKGVRISELPIDYLRWLIANATEAGEDLKASFKAAWDERFAQTQTKLPWQQQSTPPVMATVPAGRRFLDLDE